MSLDGYEYAFRCKRVYDGFRSVPENEALVPLVEAFAQAAAQIPTIRLAVLQTTLGWSSGLWFVLYAMPWTQIGW